MKVYHLGICLEKNKTRMIVQARECVDFLSCEIYEYLGRRQTTKKQLYEKRFGLLEWANKQFGFNCTSIKID